MANGTTCYSILYCNSPRLYIRLKNMYSVISVKLDWLPGNSKKWTINYFGFHWHLSAWLSLSLRLYSHLSPSPYPPLVPSDTTSSVCSFPGHDHWGGTPPLHHGRAAAKPTISARQRLTMFVFSFVTTCHMLPQRHGLQHTPHPCLHHTSLPPSWHPHPPTHDFLKVYWP